MESTEYDWNLKKGCAILEEYVESRKEYLEKTSEVGRPKDEATELVSRPQIAKVSNEAVVLALRKRLAYLKGQLKSFSGEIHAYPVEIPILLNVAKSLEKTLALELQETLLTEKERRQILKDTLARKKQIVEEREKVLTNALEMRKKLESSQDELEKAKIKQLEEKLASIRRKYGEMKIHLKATVEKLFPEPVQGYLGMYSILNVLTQPLTRRERETYVKVSDTMWPFYIELLHRHGIVEYHPTDKERIRIVDFSDGRLGSS